MKSIPLLRLLVPLCVGIGVGDYAFPWLFPHTRLLLLLPLVLIMLGGYALFRRIEGKWLSLLTTTLAFSLGIYNPQNEKLHRIKTKSCLAENETSPIKLHPTLAL